MEAHAEWNFRSGQVDYSSNPFVSIADDGNENEDFNTLQMTGINRNSPYYHGGSASGRFHEIPSEHGNLVKTRSGTYGKFTHGFIGNYRTVAKGQRLGVWSIDGKLQIIDGPARPFLRQVTSEFFVLFRADAQQYLIVKLKNGQVQHIPGPTQLYFDPTIHDYIAFALAINLNNGEAMVVYRRTEGEAERRVVTGPSLFVPDPQEWIQEFRWGESSNKSKPFKRLRLVPDSVFMNIQNVRTVDDALLTLDFMVVFHLLDIPKMLGETDNPIAAFTTAMCSDVIRITSKLSLTELKDYTVRLSDVGTYKNLNASAKVSGFEILRVIFRGFTPTKALEKLQENNVQRRLELQLEKEVKVQQESLLSYVQHCTNARDAERRDMESMDHKHSIAISRLEQEKEISVKAGKRELERETSRIRMNLDSEYATKMKLEEMKFLEELKSMGVDLTQYLVSKHEAKPDKFVKIEAIGHGEPGQSLHFHASA